MSVNQKDNRVLDAALDYHQRGLRVTPVKYRSKAALLNDWRHQELDENTLRANFEGAPMNVGVVLGEASGDLVDVDLDSLEAIALGDKLLPDTRAVFGRKSKPRSHRLYYAPGAASKAFKDIDGTMVLELRANGGQTVFPPSVHESGECIQWDGENGTSQPSRVDAEELERACRERATAALIARYLPPTGGRHDFALPLIGYLLHRLDAQIVARVVHAAWDVAGGATQEAHRDLDGIIHDAAERLEAGERIVGGLTLEEQIPGLPKALAKVWEWTNKRSSDTPTHDELADRFLSANPGYGYGQGEWKRYENGIWVPVTSFSVERQIKTVLVAAKPEGTKPTAALLTSVEKMAKVDVAVSDDLWDADPDILVCNNGTLHVPTGELRMHKPEHYATSGVPYDYEPEAAAPTWRRFLEDFVDPGTARFLQEFTGYALTTDVSHETALWLYGPPGGGRSTFIAGLEAMLGEKTGTLGLAEIERSQFALADIPGKTLLTATEQPAGYMKASYILNALISGDKQKVEKKYKDAYEIYPKAKILWAMNDLPRIPSANDGLFRRVKVIEIEPVPEGERDPEIKEAIKEEGAGILNWALEGLKRLRERERFETPEAVRDATARWREMNDVPAMFVADECETGEAKSVRGSELYFRYRLWCENNGHKPKSITHIAEDWRRLGFRPKRDSKGVGWLGVELRDKGIFGAFGG